MSEDLRTQIQTALADFESYPLKEAAVRFFNTLGYASERSLDISSVQEFCEAWDKDKNLTDREREQLNQLDTLHFLFQLTDAELTSQSDLFDSATTVDGTRMHSYLFFSAELPEGAYTRTLLSGIARAINKPLAMPALVLFRHGDTVSLAIIHRRLHKRQADRDVLEKATLIKDIRLADPIRAHLEILNDFVCANLDADFAIHNFVSLHQAWQKRLDTFSLNERFYREVADWYFWAHHLIADGTIVPPPHVDTDPERSLFLIRLLTRLIFCWFLQEKRLLPGDLFREHKLEQLLKDFTSATDPKEPDLAPSYYRAVLQNLFFATLNQPQLDDDGNPNRAFRERTKSGRFDPNRGVTNLWRYKDYFHSPEDWETLTASIPFLNGGLFDCLDRVYQKSEEPDNSRLDGFSDNPRESTTLPNDLFFGPERPVDLSMDYGEEKKKTARSKKAKVRGLIHILSRYKFTMEENTPLDEEIALDPELLGKVFENLLASYNPETKDTARKQTGSFYTPRAVVSFMVDEALLAYLDPILGGNESGERLRSLFEAPGDGYDSAFDADETSRLVRALDDVKILDPACGSGAYPMGALHRLVDLLRKLDPDNSLWEARQKARLEAERCKAKALNDPEEQKAALAEVKHRADELRPIFNAARFDRDYARKLFLIENGVFGVDKQPVAVQIAKLRFFIALICDQKTSTRAANRGVLPLPNLETRLVAANTLLPIENVSQHQFDLLDVELRPLRRELEEVRHEHFRARSPKAKRRCRERDASLREKVSELLKQNGMPANTASKLAAWDPYGQNDFADFFDPAWMFGDAYLGGKKAADAGFDIVIGNPPYVRQEKIKDQKDALKPHYSDTFTGTNDLYVYFYDRALQLLHKGGVLSYISSNKWYRSGYGKKLREHMAKSTTILHAIDFGDAPVFTAIAYPTIVVTKKCAPSPKHAFRALNWDPKTPNSEIANFASFYTAKAQRVAQNSLSAEAWRFMSSKHQELLEKIRNAGTPLGEFVNGRFYYGIKTGLNEAFVVDPATRDQLIADDPKSEEILKPFLRGRDVKRWRIDYADLWLILIESSENKRHPWTGKKPDEAEKIFKLELPAIYKHFKTLREKLIKRCDQGHYFWELRSCAYYDAFAGPKIAYPDIAQRPEFAYDNAGRYLVNTLYLIPCTEKWLLSVLNSKVIWWYYNQISNQIRGGFVRYIAQYVSQIPIPDSALVAAQKDQLVHQVELITFLENAVIDHPNPRDPLMRDYYEDILNALVYELYMSDDLQAAGLHFFDLVAAAKLPVVQSDTTDSADQIKSLRTKFEEIYEPSHPLRAALQKLRTLEPIRIIEGKA